MSNVTFKKLVRPSLQVFHALAREGAVPSKVLIVLEEAFNHGGYVAGGFARYLLSGLSLSGEKQELLEQPSAALSQISGSVKDNYLRTDMKLGRFAGSLNGGTQKVPERFMRGDIDVFFENEEARVRFIDKLSMMKGSERVNTVTGLAQEFVIDNAVRIQVNMRKPAKIEDILGSFDIMNAMVAFNHESFVVVDGWFELEKSSTLHVQNWKQNCYTFSRIRKWCSRHGYINLSEDTIKQACSAAYSTLKTLKESNLPENDVYAQKQTVCKVLRKHMPYMTDEQLIFIAPLYNDDSHYNVAVGRLMNRMKSNIEKDTPIF